MFNDHPLTQEATKPVPIVNQYAGELPPYSTVVVKGCERVDGVLHYKVDRLSGEGTGDSEFSRMFLVTGPVTIPRKESQQTGTGLGYYGFLTAKRSDSSPPPLNGGMGPKPGSFELWTGYPELLTAAGDVSGANRLVGGYFHPLLMAVYGKTKDNEAFTKNSTADIRVFWGVPGEGQWIESSFLIRQVRNPWGNIPAGATGKVIVVKWFNGYPTVAGREC